MRKLALVFTVLLISSCQYKKKEDNTNLENRNKILKIQKDYVDSWLQMDEQKVLFLFEDDARIQPNRLAPIEGKENMRAFWFPKDGSQTTINSYETELVGIDITDTIAISTQKSNLDWSYTKDTISFSMFQRGVGTTIYRKQKDSSWKIWRQMWTDVYSKKK